MTQKRWIASGARLVRYACLGIALVGCAHTRTAEKAASMAMSQLDIYDRDIGAKIRAESNYYEEVMAAARANTSDLWRNEQPARFEQEAKAFTRANQNLSAEAADAQLADLLKTFIVSWSRRDADYAALLADAVQVLSDNRKKLEVEQAKISQLRSKLMTLSEAASDKEMLKLAIGFVKETKDKIDELSKDASKPATGR